MHCISRHQCTSVTSHLIKSRQSFKPAFLFESVTEYMKESSFSF